MEGSKTLKAQYQQYFQSRNEKVNEAVKIIRNHIGGVISEYGNTLPKTHDVLLQLQGVEFQDKTLFENIPNNMANEKKYLLPVTVKNKPGFLYITNETTRIVIDACCKEDLKYYVYEPYKEKTANYLVISWAQWSKE